MPRKVFVANEILTAADVNTNLMDQAVMVFADAAARTTAIPSPSEGMVTYLSDVNRVEAYTGAAFVAVNSGFTAQTTITATDASFSVPALGFPIVKVTVIGGGGGGGGGDLNSGSAGGTSTFNAAGAGSISAAGGYGGKGGNNNNTGTTGGAGFGAQNGGEGTGGGDRRNSQQGGGGRAVVSYLNLTGVTTVNVTIGAGGAGGAGGGGSGAGGTGGRGEVIVEYVAG